MHHRTSSLLLALLVAAPWTAFAARGEHPLAPCLDRTLAARERVRLALASESAPHQRPWPAADDLLAPDDFVIQGHSTEWDANGVIEGGPDTLVVPTGASVRWHRASGLHTITDGRGLDDPEAGRMFDYLLDDTHADFDTVFSRADTIRYFCAFHDPHMRGVLVISASASVDPRDPPLALRFSRPPAPNPTRRAVAFAVGLPAARRVELDVRDIQGRQVAALQHGELPAGEHVFRWNGTLRDGRPAAAGVYLAWLTDGNRVMSRRFTLLR